MDLPDDWPEWPRGRWQFSLQSLFVVTACFAVGCSVVFGLPDWAAGPLFILSGLSAPPVCILVLRRGNADQRAFALGALFPAGYMLFPLTTTLNSPLSGAPFSIGPEWVNRLIYLFLWLGGMAVAGSTCLAVSRYLAGVKSPSDDSKANGSSE